MGLIVLLVVGGLIGWVASVIMRIDRQQGIVLNVVVGIVGALIAGFLITPLIGGARITSGEISIQSAFVSLLGADVLLVIINLFTEVRFVDPRIKSMTKQVAWAVFDGERKPSARWQTSAGPGFRMARFPC